MGERRVVYRILMWKSEVKRPFGKPRRKWEDNLKMTLQDVGCAGRDWIELTLDRDRCWEFVNAVMNFRVP